MSKHSFSTEIANDLGINTAVIFNHLIYWIDTNCKSNHNFRDGKFWTYNSIKKFSNTFTYMSERQISKCLDDLEKLGYIESANYNETKYDRTKWYTITKKGFEYYVQTTNQYFDNLQNALYENVKSIMQKSEMEIAKKSNPNVENVEPIPDINSIDKTDNKPNKNKGFDFSFVHSEILESVMEYIQYRKDIKKPFVSQTQIETWYKKLRKISKSNIETAKTIIENGIASGYQGIFEIYEKPNFNKEKTIDYKSTKQIEMEREVYAKARIQRP